MPAHSIAFSRTISPAHASVLDDAVHNLADHFEADGLAWAEAFALAHKILCIDPAQLQTALESIEVEAAAQRADMAAFRAKARAVEASYMALVQ
jgi:hypothetical protein